MANRIWIPRKVFAKFPLPEGYKWAADTKARFGGILPATADECDDFNLISVGYTRDVMKYVVYQGHFYRTTNDFLLQTDDPEEAVAFAYHLFLTGCYECPTTTQTR